MKLSIVGLGAAAALCLAAGARAQVSVHHGPLEISAKHSEYIEGEHLIILTGEVEALQKDDRLRADLVRIYTKPTTAKGSGGAPAMGDIDRIEATGNVYMVSPREVVRGDKAVYTTADDTTVVTGDVVLAQGENVGRGRRLVMNRATGKSTLDPGEDQDRVHFVVFPKDKPEGEKK